MSFSVYLYTNNSNVNVVSKSLTQVATATGTLRASTSIIDPVITIESQLAAELISECNYLRIPLFNRYYYITNIISEVTSLWTIHCHVDVLMSFGTYIRNQTALVARQEMKYNLYLDDGSFMAYQNPMIDTCPFSESHPFNEDGQFVLTVAGGNNPN